MSGGVELARCDFCCEVTPVARQYLHAKNADQFAIVRFCGDCGCAESEQLAEIAALRCSRRVLLEALEAQEKLEASVDECGCSESWCSEHIEQWMETAKQRQAALEMCREVK